MLERLSEPPNQVCTVPAGFRPVATRGALQLLEATDPPAHQQLQSFIRQQFHSHFGAEVPDDTPRLLGIFDSAGELIAAFGIRTRADGFFSEHYLGTPLDAALFEKTGKRIDQERIVEVSHFSLAGRRGFSGAVPLMAEGLSRLKFDHVVCTATRCLIRYFARRYLTPLILADARAENLPESLRTCWGSYYHADPAVAFGPLAVALETEHRR